MSPTPKRTSALWSDKITNGENEPLEEQYQQLLEQPEGHQQPSQGQIQGQQPLFQGQSQPSQEQKQ